MLTTEQIEAQRVLFHAFCKDSVIYRGGALTEFCSDDSPRAGEYRHMGLQGNWLIWLASATASEGRIAELTEALKALQASPLPELVKGRMYESTSHGNMVYVGVDTFHGQMTHEFRTEQYGTKYFTTERLGKVLARPAALAGSATPSTPEVITKGEVMPVSEQIARQCIDGAIARGRMGINKPPSDDHWLMEYWQIGRQLAKLGETSAWDNVTPAAPVPQDTLKNADSEPKDVCAEMRALCSACGGTGDVHGLDGEWRGECDCPASQWKRDETDAARYRYLCDNAYREHFDLSESQESINRAIDAARTAAIESERATITKEAE